MWAQRDPSRLCFSWFRIKDLTKYSAAQKHRIETVLKENTDLHKALINLYENCKENFQLRQCSDKPNERYALHNTNIEHAAQSKRGLSQTYHGTTDKF